MISNLSSPRLLQLVSHGPVSYGVETNKCLFFSAFKGWETLIRKHQGYYNFLRGCNVQLKYLEEVAISLVLSNQWFEAVYFFQIFTPLQQSQAARLRKLPYL